MRNDSYDWSAIMKTKDCEYLLQLSPERTICGILFHRRWIVVKGWVIEQFFSTYTILSALGGIDEIPNAVGPFKTNREANCLANKWNSEIVKNEEPETWEICRYTWQETYRATHKNNKYR